MRALACILFLGQAAGAATAEEPRAPELADQDQSRFGAARAFGRGQAAYRAKRCREAALAFAEAYALDPLPSLLYDEGEAWRCEHQLTGDPHAAQTAVRKLHAYLVDPDGVA